MFARNVCFSRSEWQDPRPMRPFPGAIGWFWIHGVRILPGRSPFRVERPEIMHGTKMLPGLLAFKAGKKIGSPNGDPINEFFGSAQRLPDALQPLHQAEELAVSCLEELHQANELALSHLGGLRKWVHRRCGLSMRFPVWRNCTRRTSLRFPSGRIKPSERTCAFLPGSQHPTEFQGLHCRT